MRACFTFILESYASKKVCWAKPCATPSAGAVPRLRDGGAEGIPGKIGDGYRGGSVHVPAGKGAIVAVVGVNQLRFRVIEGVFSQDLSRGAGGVDHYTAGAFVHAQGMIGRAIPDQVASQDQILIGWDWIGQVLETCRQGKWGSDG